MEEALRGMVPKLSPEMNEHLSQPFTDEEITEALAQICPTEALHLIDFLLYSIKSIGDRSKKK